MASTIYLLESNKSFAQEIVNTAIRNGYEIFIFSHLINLFKEVRTQEPTAIFINFEKIPSSDDHLRVLKKFYTIVYGNKIDYDLKHRFYNLGVNRVLTELLTKPAVMLQILNLEQYCRDELRLEINKNMTLTNLRDVKLRDVLLTTAQNKRNLILKIQDDNWYAKLRIQKGSIVEAYSPGKDGIAAVLDILTHRKGKLSMQSFPGETVMRNIHASTYSILLEADFQQKVVNQFHEQLQVDNPLLYKVRENFANEMNERELYVFRSFQDDDHLSDLLQNSPYAASQTLEILDSLLQKGIVNVSFDKTRQDQLTRQDIDYIYENLWRGRGQKGQIFILNSGKHEEQQIMTTIAEGMGCKLVKNKGIYLTQSSIGDNLILQFMGVSPEFFIENIDEDQNLNLLGAILTFDFSREQNFEYQRYFIHQFFKNFRIPVVIGLFMHPEMNENFIARFRQKLTIPDQVKTVIIDPENFQEIKSLIYHMTEVQPEEMNI